MLRNCDLMQETVLWRHTNSLVESISSAGWMLVLDHFTDDYFEWSAVAGVRVWRLLSVVDDRRHPVGHLKNWRCDLLILQLLLGGELAFDALQNLWPWNSEGFNARLMCSVGAGHHLTWNVFHLLMRKKNCYENQKSFLLADSRYLDLECDSTCNLELYCRSTRRAHAGTQTRLVNRASLGSS